MIMVDATPLQSEHRARGVGTYTRHLCEGVLDLIPDQVRFLASSIGLEWLPEPVRSRALLIPRGHSPAQVYWLYNELLAPGVLRRHSPSLFHATDFNGLVSVRGLPSIATLYDLTPIKQGFHGRSLSQRLSDTRWRVYYYHKLQRAAHIVAISEQVKRDAIDLLGLRPETITAIPLGVDGVQFFQTRGTGRFASSGPYFAFSGTRAPNKNLDRVLQAFSTVSSQDARISLFLSGPWPDQDLRWLQSEARRLGVEGRVSHVGFLSQEDLRSFYGNARAFVFPSIEEGFGLPVLEAMACGAPVITSNRSVLPEVAGDAALLVDPYDVGAISGAMTALLNDETYGQVLVEKGFLRAREFSWSRVAEATVDVYRRLVASL